MSDAVEEMLRRTITPRPDCRVWMGATDNGYGRVFVDGRARRAHRVMWELVNGPIPDDLTIDHLCRIRACINPDHMELVTVAENSRRATRGKWIARSIRPRLVEECQNGHPYNDENTRIDARGRRSCRVCARLRQAEYVRRRAGVSP